MPIRLSGFLLFYSDKAFGLYYVFFGGDFGFYLF